MGLESLLAIADKHMETQNLVWPGLDCCKDFFLAEFCTKIIKFQLKNNENSGVFGGSSKSLSLRNCLNVQSSASKKRKTRSSNK